MTAMQHELVRELAGNKCFCGKEKTPAQTFCSRDYFLLPSPLRKALYRRVGHGYEEAYKEAREFLKGLAIAKKAIRKPRAPSLFDEADA